MIYLLSILFTLAFVYYSKFQLMDLRGYSKTKTRNTKWKPFGAALRILFFVSCYVVQQYFPASWQDYLLAGTINMFLFPLLLNWLAYNLDKGLWYTGSEISGGGWIDKTFGKLQWFIFGGLIISSLIIKLLT